MIAELLSSALGLALYLNTLSADFCYDDRLGKIKCHKTSYSKINFPMDTMNYSVSLHCPSGFMRKFFKNSGKFQLEVGVEPCLFPKLLMVLMCLENGEHPSCIFLLIV
ncbi:hypothetical protein DUI87_23735 [Hirundo rustica rustica]|uniref:Uncharacterized protein n=1 Tax=Hirundo rustica rustica TaxID=333673 RepID=A0A3M0JKZ9_HIRRU|nr:hypothetical protein DUI87_23735 [Hirundo rustica rustica]